MAKVAKKRICPETGKMLVRDVRPVEFPYKDHTVTLEQPGWYATDGGREALHSGEDMQATQEAFAAFKARVDHILTPREARDIRRRLKLTQREAGMLLGGGPRSFQKYEKGVVRLSVSMSNLLRLLNRDSSRIEELRESIESDREALSR